MYLMKLYIWRNFHQINDLHNCQVKCHHKLTWSYITNANDGITVVNLEENIHGSQQNRVFINWQLKLPNILPTIKFCLQSYHRVTNSEDTKVREFCGFFRTLKISILKIARLYHSDAYYLFIFKNLFMKCGKILIILEILYPWK